jgi:hypothetical protein
MMIILNLFVIDTSKRGLELKKDILQMVEVEGQADVYLPFLFFFYQTQTGRLLQMLRMSVSILNLSIITLST